jgi:O-antigen/teichoic acid export membrane protein
MNAASALLDRNVPASAPVQRPASAPRALGKGILSILDQAVVSGTSFVTSVVIGRLGSRADLGVYALALSVVLFLRGLQGELVCSPYTVYSGRRRDDPAYTGSALVHYLLLTALSTLVLLGLAGTLALLGGGTLAGISWLLAGVLPFLALREFFRLVSLAHLRLRAVLALDLSVAGVQLGGLFLLGWLHCLTVNAAFAVMGTACAIACLGWVLARRQPLRVVPARLAADWRHNWGFARWSLASFLIGNATPYLLPWAVATAHGEAATGLLAACITLVNCAGMYVTGVANFLTPQAARAFAGGGVADLRRVLGRTAILFLVTLGVFFLGILLTGDLAARLVYGDRYAGTAAVLAVLALAMLVNSLGVTAGNGLWALDQPQANFAADVCTFTVTVGLLLALVGPCGVTGAAIAVLAGTCVGACTRGVKLARLLAAVPCKEGA